MPDATGTIEDMQKQIGSLQKQVDALRDMLVGGGPPGPRGTAQGDRDPCAPERINAEPDAPPPLNNPALFAVLNFGLLEDRHPTHTDDKSGDESAYTKFNELQELLETDCDVNQAVYMLATFCFDTAKRFAVVHSAVNDELVNVEFPLNSCLEARLKDEDTYLNSWPTPDPHRTQQTPWAERAKRAAELLKGWHKTANEKWDKRLTHLEWLEKRRR